MPPFDKSTIVKGMMLTGDNYPVAQMALLKRDQIQKGMMIHGGECPTYFRPKAPTLEEIAKQIKAATERLNEIRQMVRKP